MEEEVEGETGEPVRLSTRARGREGEEEAVGWLERAGYRILARNLVNHGGEIDVVARDGDTLCFVEIKARLTDAYGPAIEAVDAQKQRRLSRAAALYLVAQDPGDAPCRFDVLGLDWIGGEWRFTLVRDAFPFQGPRGW